ncbi:MAG TPA: hypothetical protein VGQ76_27350, partial [Thermoanaerobaculia bacterium]|nr:hypothetical protein [Thermoanaerobaculia bacterium]
MDPTDKSWSQASEGVEFERFALSVLSAQSVADEKVLLIGNELPRELAFADAFAPAGFMDLPGPCVIEVRIRF